MSLKTVPISAFQATYIGSPYSAQLIGMSIEPTWQPSVKAKNLNKLKDLPSFVQAIDHSLREVLAKTKIPSRFDSSQIYALIMSKLSDYVESEKELKYFVHKFEKTRPNVNSLTYIKMLKKQLKEIEEHTPTRLSQLSYEGLLSDIPFAYFCDLSLAFATYQKLFHFIVKVAETKLKNLHVKGVRKYYIDKKVMNYINEIKPVMIKYVATVESQLRITLYLDIANSESYERIFEHKILSYERLDTLTFSEYYEDFRANLYALRDVLFKKSPSLFSDSIDLKSPINHIWVTSAKQALGDLVIGGKASLS